jgi:hypothetical protein
MANCPVCGNDIGEKSFDNGGWCPKCVGTKEYMRLEGKLGEYNHNAEEIRKTATGNYVEGFSIPLWVRIIGVVVVIIGCILLALSYGWI